MAHRGTPDTPLDAHAIREERARVAGDVVAAREAQMIKHILRAGEVLTVPADYMMLCAGELVMEDGSELSFDTETSELHFVDQVEAPDVPAPVSLDSLIGSNSSVISASGYLLFSGLAMQANLGYVMDRPGWIVGLSFALNCTVATSPGSFVIRARRNGANAYSCGLTINSTGIKNSNVSQAKGLTPFKAGDVLSLYADFVSFVGSVDDTLARLVVQY